MDGAAVIGGVVSLVAAAVAAWQAWLARQSAWKVASLNHQIAALDREADQFRADVAAVFGAVAALRKEADMMPLVAAATVLQVNPRASVAVVKASEGLVAAMAAGLKGVKAPESAAGTLQVKARGVLKEINAERLALLQQRDRVRWWPRRRTGGE